MSCEMACGNATCAEKALCSLVKCFREHACSDGDGDTLSKKEFKKLLDKEFPNLVPKDAGCELEKKMQSIAGDTVDLCEYLQLCCVLGFITDMMMQCQKK